MSYDLEALKRRLNAFSKRLEGGGEYSNEAIVRHSSSAIEKLEEALWEAINFMDHALNQGGDDLREHREAARAKALRAINYNRTVNERGEVA